MFSKDSLLSRIFVPMGKKQSPLALMQNDSTMQCLITDLDKLHISNI